MLSLINLLEIKLRLFYFRKQFFGVVFSKFKKKNTDSGVTLRSFKNHSFNP